MVGNIFADQIDAAIRHHAAEAGCFVVNATGWLSEAQIAAVTPDAALQKSLRGGCHTAIISPEGAVLGTPLREGEGMVIADLDLALVTKRKRMMDSVGHYARPELLSLAINDRAATPTVAMHATTPIEIPRSPDHEHDHSAAAFGRQPAVDDRAAVLRVAAG